MSKLYVMAGFSGTGKSMVADILSHMTEANIHRTDAIRKEIVSGEPTRSSNSEWLKSMSPSGVEA
jgi:predicted kinase